MTRRPTAPTTRWSGLPTSCVSDALDALGIPGQALGIRCIGSPGPVTGPAFTVRYLPASRGEGDVGDFLDDVPPGSVLVLDNSGRRDVTVWGGILTLAARRRGVLAAVLHGMCRDVSTIRRLGFPVFARGNTMRTGKDRVRAVGYKGPVSLGAVTVSPGDIVIADSDGVVVVPKVRERDVQAAAAGIAARELRIERAVLAGQRLDAARRRNRYHALQRGGAGDGAGQEDDSGSAEIGSATASDALEAPYVLPPRIIRLSGTGVVLGPAFTAACRAGSNHALHEALASARPGSVLVAASDPEFVRGSWGELMSSAAVRRGIAGLVLEGHVRDLEGIRATGFPVWALGTCPLAAGKAADAAATGIAVSIGDVRVEPGDCIVADDDGVCVVPAVSRDAVLASAAERVRWEEELRTKIRAGHGVLGGLNTERKES